MVLAFWQSEEMPAEWETGLLKILPKKGDKSLPGNYRGIMMLEVAYKMVALILHARLTPICESIDHLDHETQCGFRGERGCADAIFTLKQLIRKRREHGLETWVLFIDLVKAFDRVPREALLDPNNGLLWLVLLRYGVPPKLVSLLREMHRNMMVQFDVDGVLKTIEAIIGVKQGDLLGPLLFTFFMAAVKSANTKNMECGHVAPSCARRCAGSRLPDHARCSFFVRSRHRARVRPRRSIHLPAGSMWRAHQHSHKHVWPRTTFNKGGHETIRQRGRHRQRIFYATHDVSVHLTQPRARLWARSASGQQHSFCQHVPSMPPLPCHACHAAPHLAAPCCAGAARPLLRFVQDAAISRCSPGPPGRLRLRCMCVCVCWVW